MPVVAQHLMLDLKTTGQTVGKMDVSFRKQGQSRGFNDNVEPLRTNWELLSSLQLQGYR